MEPAEFPEKAFVRDGDELSAWASDLGLPPGVRPQAIRVGTLIYKLRADSGPDVWTYQTGLGHDLIIYND